MLPLYVYLRRKRIRVKHAVIAFVLLMILIQVLLKLRKGSHHHLDKRHLVTPRTCVALFLVLHFRVPHEIFISTPSRLNIKAKLAAYTNTSKDHIFLDDKITHNGLPQSMQNQSFYMRGSADSNGKCGYVWGFDSQNREVLYDTCAEANLNNSWKFCKLPHDVMTRLSSQNFADIDQYCRPNLAAAWPLGNITECATNSSNDATKWVESARSLDNDLMKDEMSQIIGYAINAWQVLGLVVEYDENLLHSGFHLIGTTDASLEKTTRTQIASESFKMMLSTDGRVGPSPVTVSTSSSDHIVTNSQLTVSTSSAARIVINTPSEHFQSNQGVVPTPAYRVTTSNKVSVVTTDDANQESYTFNKQAYMDQIRKIYPEFFSQTPEADVSAFTTNQNVNRREGVDMTSGTESTAELMSSIQSSVSVVPQSFTKDPSPTANDTLTDLYSLQQIIYKIYGVLLDNFPQPLSSLLSNMHNATDHTHVSLPKQYYGIEGSFQADDSPTLSQPSIGSVDHQDNVKHNHDTGYSKQPTTAEHPSVTSKGGMSSHSINEATGSSTSIAQNHNDLVFGHISYPTVTKDEEFGLYSGDGSINPYDDIGVSSSTVIHSRSDQYDQLTSPKPQKSEAGTQNSRLQEFSEPVLSTPLNFGDITMSARNPGIESVSTSKPFQRTTTNILVEAVVSQDSSSTIRGDQQKEIHVIPSQFLNKNDMTSTSSKLFFDYTLLAISKMEADNALKSTSRATSDATETLPSAAVTATTTGDHLNAKTALPHTTAEDTPVILISESTRSERGGFQSGPVTSLSEESMSEFSNTVSAYIADYGIPQGKQTTVRQEHTIHVSKFESENTVTTNLLQSTKDSRISHDDQYTMDPFATESVQTEQHAENQIYPTVKSASVTHSLSGKNVEHSSTQMGLTTLSHEPIEDSYTNLNTKFISSETVKPIIIHEITLPSVDASTTASTASIYDTLDSSTTLPTKSEDVASGTQYGTFTVSSDRPPHLANVLTTSRGSLAVEGPTLMTSASQPNDSYETKSSITESLSTGVDFQETTLNNENVNTDFISLPIIEGTTYDDTITTDDIDGRDSSGSWTPSSDWLTTVDDGGGKARSTHREDVPLTGVDMVTAHAELDDNSTDLPASSLTTDIKSHGSTDVEFLKVTSSFITSIPIEPPGENSQGNFVVDTTTKKTTGAFLTSPSSLDTHHYATTLSVEGNRQHIEPTVVNGISTLTHNQQSSIDPTTTKNIDEISIFNTSEGAKISEYEVSTFSDLDQQLTTEDDSKSDPKYAETYTSITHILPSESVKATSTPSYAQGTISKTSTESSTYHGEVGLTTNTVKTKEIHSTVLPVSFDVHTTSKDLVVETSAPSSSTQPTYSVTTTNKELGIPTRVTSSQYPTHSTVSPVSSVTKPTPTSSELAFVPISNSPTAKQSTDSTLSVHRTGAQDGIYSTLLPVYSQTFDYGIVHDVTLKPIKDQTSTISSAEVITQSNMPVAQTLTTGLAINPTIDITTVVSETLNVPTQLPHLVIDSTILPMSLESRLAHTGVKTPVPTNTGAAIKHTTDVNEADPKTDTHVLISKTQPDMLSTVLVTSTMTADHDIQHGGTPKQIYDVTSTIPSTESLTGNAGQVPHTSNVEQDSDGKHATSTESDTTSTTSTVYLGSNDSPTASPAVVIKPIETATTNSQLHYASLSTLSHINFTDKQQGTQSASTEITESGIDATSIGTLTEISVIDRQQETISSSTVHDVTSDHTRIGIDLNLGVETLSTVEYATPLQTGPSSSKVKSKSEVVYTASIAPTTHSSVKTTHLFNLPSPTTSTNSATLYSNYILTGAITNPLSTQYMLEADDSITANTIDTTSDVPVTTFSPLHIPIHHPVSSTQHIPASVSSFSVFETAKTASSPTLPLEYDKNIFTYQTPYRSLDASVSPVHTFTPASSSGHSSQDSLNLLTQTMTHGLDHEFSSTVGFIPESLSSDQYSIPVSAIADVAFTARTISMAESISATPNLGLTTTTTTHKATFDLMQTPSKANTPPTIMSTDIPTEKHTPKYPDLVTEVTSSIVGQLFQHPLPDSLYSKVDKESLKVVFKSAQKLHASEGQLLTNEWLRYCEELDLMCGLPISRNPSDVSQSLIYDIYIASTTVNQIPKTLTLHISVYPKQYDKQQDYLITTVLDVKTGGTITDNDLYSQYPVTFVMKLSSHLSSGTMSIDPFSINVHNFEVLSQRRRRRSTYSTVKVDWTISDRTFVQFNESLKHLILVNGTSMTNYEFFVAMLPEMIVSSTNVSSHIGFGSKSKLTPAAHKPLIQSNSVGLSQVLPPVFIGLFGLASCCALIAIRCRKKPTFFFVSQYLDRTYEKRKPVLIDDDVELDDFPPGKVKFIEEINQSTSQSRPKRLVPCYMNKSASDHDASSLSDGGEDGSYSFRDFSFVIDNHVL